MAGEACQPFGAGQRLRSRLPFSVGPLKRAVESSWCSHQHSVGKCMHPKKNNMTVLEIRYKCVSIPKENANLVATLPAQQSERLRSARGSSGQWKSVGPTESHSPASDALHVPKQSSPQPPLGLTQSQESFLGVRVSFQLLHVHQKLHIPWVAICKRKGPRNGSTHGGDLGSVFDNSLQTFRKLEWIEKLDRAQPQICKSDRARP